MADTAALVVALSAQLTKFEKDMKDAVKVADTRTKEIENSFSKLNQSINSELSGFVQGYASRLGSIGTVLGALGPVGLGVAAAIGGATLAVSFLNDKVDKFVEKQKAMRETAEVTGLTLDQLKAIGQSATRTGVDFEKAERGIIRMATAVDDLRQKGTGPLVDSLNKLNPELVKQLITASSTAEAFDILSKALDQMEGDFRAVGFSAELFGKRNVEVLRVLKDLVAQGGLVKTALDMREQGKGIDQDLNERLVKLQIQIDATRKRADNLFGAFFAEFQKGTQLEFAQGMEFLAQKLKDSKSLMWELVAAIQAYIATKPGVESANKELENLRVPQLTMQPRGTVGGPLFGGGGAAPTTNLTDVIPGGLPRTQTQMQWWTPEVDAALKQFNKDLADQEALLLNGIKFNERWAGLLGDSVRPAEAYRLKQDQINKALTEYAPGSEEAIRLQEAGRRSLELLSAQQAIAVLQIRERLGIATEEEIVQREMLQLQLEANRAGQAGIDMTNAEILAHKRAKEAIEQRAVALSRLPEATRYAQQATDLWKNIDQTVVSFAGNFESAMGDIATSSKSAADAFKSLADSIIRDLVRMTIRMAVTGPILRSIGGFFGLGGATNVVGGAGLLPVPTFRQHGGPVSKGSPYIVGEHGPELFIPGQSGRITPSQPTSHGGASGKTEITVNNYAANDTETRQTRQQGPDIDRIVIDIVKKAQARGEMDDVNRGRFALRAAKVR